MEEPPRDRSPAGRFRYLAERRVPKALRAINSVTNLSDRKNYEFTEEQIIDALTESLDELKNEFARNSRSRKSSFELK